MSKSVHFKAPAVASLSYSATNLSVLKDYSKTGKYFITSDITTPRRFIMSVLGAHVAALFCVMYTRASLASDSGRVSVGGYKAT